MFGGQISYAIWLQLPVEIRSKLVTLFGVPKTGRTVVEYRSTGAVVTSDGYTATDLQSISLSKMQSLLDTEDTNYYKLFEEVISHADALLGGSYTKSVVPQAYPVAHQGSGPPTETLENEKPPFCDSCDSKGGRHKKVCPKYA